MPWITSKSALQTEAVGVLMDFIRDFSVQKGRQLVWTESLVQDFGDILDPLTPLGKGRPDDKLIHLSQLTTWGLGGEQGGGKRILIELLFSVKKSFFGPH